MSANYVELCRRQEKLLKDGRLVLRQDQFDGLEESTKREIMKQLMMIVVRSSEGLKLYSLGAQGNNWTILEHKPNEDYSGWEVGEIIERWM